MNTFTWEILGGLLLFVVMLALSYYCVWRSGREGGYEEGYADALDRKPLPGRHRASQPREVASPASRGCTPERKPDRTSLVGGWFTAPPPRPGPVTLPSGGAIAYMVARNGALRRSKPPVTAADISTVLLPPPVFSPKHEAAETGMLELSDVSTTGGFRAVTDEYIAQMMAEDAAYRESMTVTMRGEI